MSVENEIKAMSAIAASLGDLEDEAARARVLRWAAERFGVTLAMPAKVEARTAQPVDDGQRHQQRRPAAAAEPTFSDFVDLFDAVDPKSEVDKSLTAAYWLQVVCKEPSWQSLRVNNLLKDTGHGVANVTSALATAQERKPALVRQMAKSGKSQQARKTYKLTTSGIAHIRSKLGLAGAVPASLADAGEDEDA